MRQRLLGGPLHPYNSCPTPAKTLLTSLGVHTARGGSFTENCCEVRFVEVVGTARAPCCARRAPAHPSG